MNSQDQQPPEELSLLAAEYVSGLLTPEERLEVEARLPTDQALAADVRYWEQRLESLDELAPEVPPSDLVKARINRSIEAISDLTSKPTSKANESLWRRTGIWRLATAALLLLSVSIYWNSSTTPTYIVVLTAPGATEPGWMLTSRDGKALEMRPLVATEVPEGKTLEFWTKAEGWEKPVSLGLVAPDTTANRVLDQLPQITPNQLFELTIEQPGGSPTGLPTGPVQFIGRAVKSI